MDTRLIPRQANPFSASVRVLGLYIKATAIIFAWQAVLYCIAFALARVPWWAVMGVLCALFGLIPRIGSLIGIAIVLFISWVAGVDLLHLAIAGGAWVVIQAVEGFWLTPRLLGKPLGLRPMAVFLAVLVASFALGPLGLLLAVPALAIVMVWVRYFKGQAPLPPSPPPARR